MASKLLKVSCKHLVCIPTGLGIMQHIIFKPTKATTRAIKALSEADGLFLINVNDVSGAHITPRYHSLVAVRESYGTIVMTTREA